MKDIIYLAQSDTTAGFFSTESKCLNALKQRDLDKKVLLESSSLHYIKSLARVPNIHKNRVRKAAKSTFIYPNGKAIRLIKEQNHLAFLGQFGYLYATSANKSGQNFNKAWAIESSDIICIDSRNLTQGSASKIYKINNAKMKKIR